MPDFEVYMSSKNKSPWITLNGVDVADSQLSIEHLKHQFGTVRNDILSSTYYTSR